MSIWKNKLAVKNVIGMENRLICFTVGFPKNIVIRLLWLGLVGVAMLIIPATLSVVVSYGFVLYESGVLFGLL